MLLNVLVATLKVAAKLLFSAPPWAVGALLPSKRLPVMVTVPAPMDMAPPPPPAPLALDVLPKKVLSVMVMVASSRSKARRRAACAPGSSCRTKGSLYPFVIP